MNIRVKVGDLDIDGLESWTSTFEAIDAGESEPARLPIYEALLEINVEQGIFDPARVAYVQARNAFEGYVAGEVPDEEFGFEIDEEGGISLTSGGARLIMLLGLDRVQLDTLIEGRVTGRAKKWLHLKRALWRKHRDNILETPIDHPDFADWEVKEAD